MIILTILELTEALRHRELAHMVGLLVSFPEVVVAQHGAAHIELYSLTDPCYFISRISS